MYYLLDDLKITATDPKEIYEQLRNKKDDYANRVISTDKISTLEFIEREYNRVVNAMEALAWSADISLPDNFAEAKEEFANSISKKKEEIHNEEKRKAEEARAVVASSEASQTSEASTKKTEIYDKYKYKISKKTVFLTLLSLVLIIAQIVLMLKLPVMKQAENEKPFILMDIFTDTENFWDDFHCISFIIWTGINSRLLRDISIVLISIFVVIVFPIASLTKGGKKAFVKIPNFLVGMLFVSSFIFLIMYMTNKAYDPVESARKARQKTVSFSYGIGNVDSGMSDEDYEDISEFTQEMYDDMSESERREFSEFANELAEDMGESSGRDVRVFLPDPTMQMNWIVWGLFIVMGCINGFVRKAITKSMYYDRKEYYSN